MSTIDLIIVCATGLLAVGLVLWAALELAQRRAQMQREVALHERITARADRDAAKPVADLAAAIATLEQAIAAVERTTAGPRPGPSLVGATVVAHTPKPDDQSIRGIVRAHHADRLELRDASYVHATGEQPAAGVVAVEFPLSSLQILEPAHGVEA